VCVCVCLCNAVLNFRNFHFICDKLDLRKIELELQFNKAKYIE